MEEHQNLTIPANNLGAVNYLNMLPFFAFAPGVHRTPVPRELNNLAREGRIAAGCLSAIAGLSSGFEPAAPFMGVGAERKVESVFLEPIIPGAKDKAGKAIAFWNDVRFRNIDGLQRLEHTAAADDEHAQNHVRILSSEASEQAEWLFRTLLLSQCIRTTVESTPPGWENRNCLARVPRLTA
jgi:hypothetical protein